MKSVLDGHLPSRICKSVKDQKQSKEENHQLLSEFNHLGVPCHYDTVELIVSLSSLYNTMNSVQQSMSKSQYSKILDEVAGLSILASRRIFLARSCSELIHN